MNKQPGVYISQGKSSIHFQTQNIRDEELTIEIFRIF